MPLYAKRASVLPVSQCMRRQSVVVHNWCCLLEYMISTSFPTVCFNTSVYPQSEQFTCDHCSNYFGENYPIDRRSNPFCLHRNGFQFQLASFSQPVYMYHMGNCKCNNDSKLQNIVSSLRCFSASFGSQEFSPWTTALPSFHSPNRFVAWSFERESLGLTKSRQQKISIMYY